MMPSLPRALRRTQYRSACLTALKANPKATPGTAPAQTWKLAVVVVVLAIGILVGVLAWTHQLEQGLAVTGLGQSVSWGLYIGLFTFFVGLAAASVLVVLPLAYGHTAYTRVAICGETFAVVAVFMAMLCVLVDLGQASRVLNILRYPNPRSIMVWDMLALASYGLMNLYTSTALIATTRQGLPPARAISFLLWPTVVLAVSIHVITAWIYAGLAARHFWLSGLLAIKFLASACASGPAVLLLLLYAAERTIGMELRTILPPTVLRSLSRCMACALGLHLACTGLEAFSALYSAVPAAQLAYTQLFIHSPLAPLFWAGLLLTVLTLWGLMAVHAKPATLNGSRVFPWLLGGVILSTGIDKTLALLIGGFATAAPRAHYLPRITELLVLTGILSTGLLILTLWWRSLTAK